MKHILFLLSTFCLMSLSAQTARLQLTVAGQVGDPRVPAAGSGVWELWWSADAAIPDLTAAGSSFGGDVRIANGSLGAGTGLFQEALDVDMPATLAGTSFANTDGNRGAVYFMVYEDSTPGAGEWFWCGYTATAPGGDGGGVGGATYSLQGSNFLTDAGPAVPTTINAGLLGGGENIWIGDIGIAAAAAGGAGAKVLAVPEPSLIAYFLPGLLLLFMRRKKD